MRIQGLVWILLTASLTSSNNTAGDEPFSFDLGDMGGFLDGPLKSMGEEMIKSMSEGLRNKILKKKVGASGSVDLKDINMDSLTAEEQKELEGLFTNALTPMLSQLVESLGTTGIPMDFLGGSGGPKVEELIKSFVKSGSTSKEKGDDKTDKEEEVDGEEDQEEEEDDVEDVKLMTRAYDDDELLPIEDDDELMTEADDGDDKSNKDEL